MMMVFEETAESDQSPFSSAVVVPMLLLSIKTSMVVPASAVPERVGVLSAVMPSVLSEPVSSVRVVITGAAGGVVASRSTVTWKASEVVDALPAVSVAVAVMLFPLYKKHA